MRLKRLDLKAFGPFTDRKPLAFMSRTPDLHIIFGPNEAGKSSSLRALKALLFGFPQQTPDNFIHSYDQLRVGGCLENSAGEEIAFQRRKKRKADVIDAAGDPLDLDLLTPFLHGVEPEIFESLYGIDHDTLVRGGEDILAQKGEVGQALFAAGAGMSSLREVIDQLEKEAADLFKPAGQLPRINMAIKRFKALQKAVKAASLSAKEWKDHQAALKNALAERAGLEKDRDHHNKALHRLNRLKQAIPELASLKSRQDQQSALGKIIPLPPDFTEQYRLVTQTMREAHQQLQKDTDRRKTLEEKQKAMSFNTDLLKQAERVDDFHQRLGEYRKGQKDRPVREGMRISLRRDAAGLLQQVRPDLRLEGVETLRPMLTKKRIVQTLSAQYEAIRHQLTLAHKQGKTAELEQKEVTRYRDTLPEVKTSQGLVQAVKPAQKAGDMDTHIARRRTDIELNKKHCRTTLKRIGLWSGDLSELMTISLPRSETVQQFETRYSKRVEERREIEKDRKKDEKDLRNAQAQIKKVMYAGEIPSETALAQTREKREQGWQLLRQQWLDQADVTEESRAYDPDLPLPEAYEGFVVQADLIADRLRREADRVANAAAFRTQVETLETSLAETIKTKAAVDQRLRELDDVWIRMWEPFGITPLSPKEMSGWLADMDKLRFKVSDIVKKEQELQRDVEQRKMLKQAMEKTLAAMAEEAPPAGDTLGPVLILAETVLERIAGQKAEHEKAKERQKKAKKASHQATEDLKAARDALAQWQAQWQKAIMGLGLEDEVSPLEALDLIETLQSCFDKLKEADDLKKRIEGIDRDAADLEAAVKALLETVAPDMLALPLDQAILQLRIMLNQAQKDATLYHKLSEELDALQEEVTGATKNLQDAREQMAELLGVAKCEKPEQLTAVIAKFTEYQRLQEKISDTEATLARIGAGMTLEALSRQAAEMNADDLPGLIDSLERDIQERIHPEINKISQVIGEENTRLSAMDGKGTAAETAEEMEHELAGIRRLSERYALLKLASKILQQAIERYREDHQDPVLKIAARYFNDLTVGSFVDLRTDVDDKGEPILIGVRPDTARLTVEKMSSGTRDQLFLALRLATLEWRLNTSESMPFIVDDILINFDDDRSRATLEVLADLSMKNQVILFTHHRQIVETATRIKGKGTIQIHTL
ncbi:YhaN family protein [Desulfobacula sp.]|uniref:YhaN family protein n=1 Tax=Desulfobacula sp. TaxID=2593537 RepID=UPI00260E9CF5|nr:YhaN family protein [Desulfobacula sp.]